MYFSSTLNQIPLYKIVISHMLDHLFQESIDIILLTIFFFFCDSIYCSMPWFVLRDSDVHDHLSQKVRYLKPKFIL